MNPDTLSKEVLALLQKAQVENAVQESLWLTAAACGISAGGVPLSKMTVTESMTKQVLDFAGRRVSGEPLQYILGNEFFGQFEFKVGPGCLIPRPETWGMVEYAVALLPRNGCFCELGTGSGAVSLSVAMLRPDVSVYASEISPDAMKWAVLNRKEQSLEKCDFRPGSLFEPFPPEQRFDCVAANLPYIPYPEKENLQKEVRDFEPATALFAEDAGCSIIEAALGQLPSRLNPHGCAIFECGTEQIPRLQKYARQFFGKVSEMKDLYGAPRFLIIPPV